MPSGPRLINLSSLSLLVGNLLIGGTGFVRHFVGLYGAAFFGMFHSYSLLIQPHHLSTWQTEDLLAWGTMWSVKELDLNSQILDPSLSGSHCRALGLMENIHDKTNVTPMVGVWQVLFMDIALPQPCRVGVIGLTSETETEAQTGTQHFLSHSSWWQTLFEPKPDTNLYFTPHTELMSLRPVPMWVLS